MEKPYAPPADPHKIIKSIEWLDDEVVDAMTKQYVQKHTHTNGEAASACVLIEPFSAENCPNFFPSLESFSFFFLIFFLGFIVFVEFSAPFQIRMLSPNHYRKL